ncbi:hypothetical protein PROFUN_09961 [Planoprotostelium fungivorum]|uniref:Uncharacterized protein n=1 Tax=Planoprotostelium fungivorum TaxID=1890364 RepID=A0A2P6NFG1_9EUKA|nr:hypothetical protein PROFUN_09961 [Planoprotostelium fungivorum]
MAWNRKQVLDLLTEPAEVMNMSLYVRRYLTYDETKSTLVSVLSRQFSPESHENDIRKLRCKANDISHHIPPDVATTNLNTKRKPIPNKSHDSMQVVAETRQLIYFSVYLALSSKKVVQRSIRWAQIESLRWRYNGPSYDISARSERLQQRDESLLLTNSGRHLTSLCHNLNIFGFLPLYSWCLRRVRSRTRRVTPLSQPRLDVETETVPKQSPRQVRLCRSLIRPDHLQRKRSQFKEEEVIQVYSQLVDIQQKAGEFTDDDFFNSLDPWYIEQDEEATDTICCRVGIGRFKFDLSSDWLPFSEAEKWFYIRLILSKRNWSTVCNCKPIEQLKNITNAKAHYVRIQEGMEEILRESC